MVGIKNNHMFASWIVAVPSTLVMDTTLPQFLLLDQKNPRISKSGAETLVDF
jgi:hypothetical protein